MTGVSLSLQKMNVITVFAEDLAETKTFYQDVLGLEVLGEETNEFGPSVVFKLGDFVINLAHVTAGPDFGAPGAVAARGEGARVVLPVGVPDVDLPADSVFELNLTGDFIPASFAAAAHLAPGLRDLWVHIDDLGAEAPSVIAELTALERLSLSGNDSPEDGPSLRLDDHCLSVISALPVLESLSLLGGSYTGHGLQQLRRLPTLRHLHVEREGLTVSMFRFAAAMPALTRLTGLDEFGDEGPMLPAEVNQVRAMLPPHISMD